MGNLRNRSGDGSKTEEWRTLHETSGIRPQVAGGVWPMKKVKFEERKAG
jgi:hypothetical protein